MEFKYIALIACVVLGIVLLFFEYRRKNRSYLYARLAATVLLVICLALLIFPVQYEVKEVSNGHSINLLTTGTSKDQVLATGVPSFTTDPGLYQTLKKSRVKYITDLIYYLSDHPEIRHINVYGYGLSLEEIRQLNKYTLSFHPPKAPSGIVSASWNNKLKSTEFLQVQGTFSNQANKTVKFYLEGFGTRLDSLTVPGGKNINFSFRDQPKQTGLAVYRLVAIAGNDTIAKEPVPFEVKPDAPGAILMLSSAPDFEFKFLKDWLFDHQYPLMLRNRISKDKFSTDFLNTPVVKLERLNTAQLQKTALLIIDEDEFTALGAGEREAVDRASSRGMGLLIRASSGDQKKLQEFSLHTENIPSLKDQEIVPELKNDTYRFSALPAGQTSFIKPASDYKMLVQTKAGKGLVSSRINGSGTLLYSVIPTTYNWVLDGKKSDYTVFWSSIIAAGIRKTTESFSYETQTSFPVISEKLTLNLEVADTKKMPQVSINQKSWSPSQHPQFDSSWQVSGWSGQSGWNTIAVNGNQSAFYVYDNTDWNSARYIKRLNFNNKLINNQNGSPSASKAPDFAKEDLSLWWFYAGFLLSAGFLWYESKNQEQNG
ncbi:hypothetical protein [Pedobacter antarcticus]|uniref:hypothetical protein n=1 Tax=Pedobacter antarcticus TaxID=34086 RepID=UPI00292DBFCA|nr:hypothetical protein [Pedobacter antarcticus]